MAHLVELEPGDVVVLANTGIPDVGNIAREITAWFERQGIKLVVFSDEVDISVIRQRDIDGWGDGHD